jgi:hypothetical protein
MSFFQSCITGFDSKKLEEKSTLLDEREDALTLLEQQLKEREDDVAKKLQEIHQRQDALEASQKETESAQIQLKEIE